MNDSSNSQDDNDLTRATDEARIAEDEAFGTALRGLAEEAGITTVWQDYRGVVHTVGGATLKALLTALDLPASTMGDVAASRTRLASESQGNASDVLPPLITAAVHAPIALPSGTRFAGCDYRIEFEDGGEVREGRFADDGPTIVDPIDRFGYHRLECDGATITLAIAPTRCYGVEDALSDVGRDRGERPWGLAAQIYSLAQDRDGGLGHYGALAALAGHAAKHGASALAISPVHAMFSADLHRYSPYGPSSRLLANILHVDPRGVLGDEAFADALKAVDGEATLKTLAEGTLVDWPASSKLRLALLRHLFDRLMTQDDAGGRAELDAFRAAGGEVLEAHARFEAIHAMLCAGDPSMLGGWRNWPLEFRDPHSAAVGAFAKEHRQDVAFHAFLQWQASRQLDAAQRAAKAAGMAIGIVADLAVGADGGGSQTWSRPRDMLIGLSIGAPPDLLNALGQSWGLAAFSPRAFRSGGFRPWIDMLRAAFSHAGGIRIDHVLGLTRMWLVPDGADAIEGAYLRYPFDDLLRLVALESWRHRAVVIGEDLGTVPEGLPERLSSAGLLGIRVLWFERMWYVPGQPFRQPHEWSDGSLAVTTTHDLPTTAGWWSGRDIDWRAKLQLFGDHSSEEVERIAREAERHMLWASLCQAGAAHGDRPSIDHPPITEALRYVGATPAPLAISPVEDALGFVEQPNLPGTIDTHPNWRMRMPKPVERLLEGDEVARRLAAFAEGRARR
ncbi:MAG: 4-alpha-glucanotransferase [Burkholderiaceae bacterium]